jgi:hypothetical protein
MESNFCSKVKQRLNKSDSQEALSDDQNENEQSEIEESNN